LSKEQSQTYEAQCKSLKTNQLKYEKAVDIMTACQGLHRPPDENKNEDQSSLARDAILVIKQDNLPPSLKVLLVQQAKTPIQRESHGTVSLLTQPAKTVPRKGADKRATGGDEEQPAAKRTRTKKSATVPTVPQLTD